MPKTILVVDDEERMRSLLQTYLVREGYRVLTAGDGKEALRLARTEKPDLIVLDVMMETGTAGFHVSYQVRKDPDFASTPILMVTAIHQTTPLRFSPDTDGEFLPVQKLLDKPVPADVLLKEVALLLEHAE